MRLKADGKIKIKKSSLLIENLSNHKWLRKIWKTTMHGNIIYSYMTTWNRWIHLHTSSHTTTCTCLYEGTNRHTWVTGRAVVSYEAGQAGYSLCCEVPDCMKHICSVDPVVIWVKRENKSPQCVCGVLPSRVHCWAAHVSSNNVNAAYSEMWLTLENCIIFPSSGWFHCYSCKHGYQNMYEQGWGRCSSLHGMSL